MNDPSPLKLGDLIDVPEVRPVIRMTDLDQEELRRDLLETFVPTEDAGFVLHHLLEGVRSGKGSGSFILGGYGSGKSHLLTVFSLILQSEPGAEILCERIDTSPPEGRFLVLNLSLIDHRGESRLEDIVLESAAPMLQKFPRAAFVSASPRERWEDLRELVEKRHRSELSAFLQERGLEEEEVFSPEGSLLLNEFLKTCALPYRMTFDRQEIFDGLTGGIREAGYRGVVVLVDELSEFLRSKPDAALYSEDIRFLQFLGEFAMSHPLWIVATLQEGIEKTGEIPKESFSKIQDRYPFRFHLSEGHIEELITGRLVIKKESARPAIDDIYDRYRKAFPGVETGRDRFYSLYPVHPTTVSFLERTGCLFSRQRSIVDFIHTRLKGCPERKIPGMLPLPCDTLLSPDEIFDHFLWRIQENPLTRPYAETVFAYHRKEAGRIFPNPEDRPAALRLLRLIILSALCNPPVRLSAKRLAELLDRRMSSLDPTANYSYVHDLLEAMRTDGAYISRTPGDSPEADIYEADLKADVALMVRRKIAAIEEEIFPGERRNLTRLISEVRNPGMPLARMYREGVSDWDVRWQRTIRKVRTVFLGSPASGGVSIGAHLDSAAGDLRDLVIFIAAPLKTGKGAPSPERTIRDSGASGSSRPPCLIWMPGELHDLDDIRRYLAHLLLLDRVGEDPSPLNRKIEAKLTDYLGANRRTIDTLLPNLYLSGRILSEEEEVSPADPGLWQAGAFERNLEKIAAPFLERRHPSHRDIAPTASILISERKRQELLERFILPGAVAPGENLPYNVKTLISGYLEPLGVAHRSERGTFLVVDPRRSEIVAHLYSLLRDGERIPFEDLYRTVHRGHFGICRDQFELLALSMAVKGYIQLHRESRKIPANRLTLSSLGDGLLVERGELLGAEHREQLGDLAFLHLDGGADDCSLPRQQEAWLRLCTFKKEIRAGLPRILEDLESLRRASGIDSDALWGITDALARLDNLLDSVRVSSTSSTGLPAFLDACGKDGGAAALFRTFHAVRDFLAGPSEEFIRIHRYIDDPLLKAGIESPGMKELAEGHRNVIRHLDLPGSLTDPTRFGMLRESFQHFRERYAALYAHCHGRAYDGDLFRRLRTFRSSREYRIFRLLSTVLPIQVEHDLPELHLMLDELEGHDCGDFQVGMLSTRPVCSCGYHPGEEVAPPGVERAETHAREGIGEILRTLRSEPHVSKIRAAALRAEDEGAKDGVAGALRAVIAVNPLEAGMIEELDPLLTPECVCRLGEALAGKQVTVERSLDGLVRRLSGRLYPAEKARRIFDDWLACPGEEGEGVRIRFTGEGPESSIEDTCLLYITDRFPALYPALAEYGWDVLNAACWVALWMKSHYLHFQSIAATFGDHGKWVALQGDLLAFGGFLLESHPDLAAILIRRAERESLTPDRCRVIEAAIPGSRGITGLLNLIEQERFFKSILSALVIDFMNAGENSWRGETITSETVQKIRCASGAEKISGCGDLAGWKRKVIGAVGFKATLLHSIGAIEKTDPALLTSGEWERLAISHLLPMESSLAELESRLEDLGWAGQTDLNPMKSRMKSLKTSFDESFGHFHSRIQERIRAGNLVPPLLITDLFSKVHAREKRKHHPGQTRFLLLSGMTWTLWNSFRELLESGKEGASGSGCTIVKEYVLWAIAPTDGETQIRALCHGLREWRERGVGPGEAARQDAGVSIRPESEIIEIPEFEKIRKYNFIENAIDTRGTSPLALYRELGSRFRKTILPLLDELPRMSMIILFSDHGFRVAEHPGGTAGEGGPLCRRGGSSPEEVLVPLAVLLRK